jgi:glyoxylase-like metal-dependent hydrolase (beta-lactamase superfamily II)
VKGPWVEFNVIFTRYVVQVSAYTCVRADNPGPFSLTGTNTYLVGRDPCWIIDPGPALPAHLDALAAEADARGGVAGIVLTHDHADHAEAVPVLAERLGVEVVAAARYPGTRTLSDGDEIGPFTAYATPGHAPDHLAYVADDVGFTGDAVLGTGSVFIWPDPGALRGYLAALARLRELGLRQIAPGHGPLVDDPVAKLDEYVAHRLDRERRLLAALDAGKRTVDELLDDAWSDAPAVLRPAAAVTLAAHLDKLEEDGRLPDGVQRPALPQLSDVPPSRT